MRPFSICMFKGEAVFKPISSAKNLGIGNAKLLRHFITLVIIVPPFILYIHTFDLFVNSFQKNSPLVKKKKEKGVDGINLEFTASSLRVS